jgi:hypothetical protein
MGYEIRKDLPCHAPVLHCAQPRDLGAHGRVRTCHIPADAIVAIQCWRAMLCLVRFRETEYTRTIVSFAATTPVIVVEFDASLSGAGLIWFARDSGAEVVLGVSAVDLSFLGFGTD